MSLATYPGARPATDEDWKTDEARFGLTDEDVAAFARAETDLEEEEGGYCIFAGGSIEGRMVTNLVHQITGVRLYRQWIPPETVRFMAEAFEDCDPEQVIREYKAADHHYEHDECTIEALRVFLRICADRHLGLVGSW